MKKIKSLGMPLSQIIAALIFAFAASVFLPYGEDALLNALNTTLVALACFAAGVHTIAAAVQKFIRGSLLNEELMITLGAILAWFLFGYRYSIMFAFIAFRLGQILVRYKEREVYSKIESSRAAPENVLVTFGGERRIVSSDDIRSGAIVEVGIGQRIPADGVVLEGESSISTFAITGAGSAAAVKPGDKVLAGCINLGGVLSIRTQAVASESVMSKLVDRVANSAGENFFEQLTRALAFFLPIVFVLSALIVYILPIIAGNEDDDFRRAALTLFVIAFPAALTVNIPMIYRSAIASAAKIGVLFRDSRSVDSLAKVRTAYIEREGFLTAGKYKIAGVESDSLSDRDAAIITLSALNNAQADKWARKITALKEFLPHDVKIPLSAKAREEENGIVAKAREASIAVGDADFMFDETVQIDGGYDRNDNVLYLAVNGIFAARFEFGDALRPDVAAAIYRLQSSDIRVRLFTDESPDLARSFRQALGFENHYSQIVPDAKAQLVSAPFTMYAGFEPEAIASAFVSATIETPTPELLMSKDIERSDVTIFSDNPLRLSDAHKIAARTRDSARFVVFLTLAEKAICVILALLGLMPFWAAIIIDAAVKFLCVSRGKNDRE
ncbi:MAG: HAD-IC family P-type ATPase [Oscillospiraceae bacterium]|jgi:Cd2+/Zn2+-exporting ATPase|nr:HAD-IC family P-type ATPase [Oscillospiraceae bacterium]